MRSGRRRGGLFSKSSLTLLCQVFSLTFMDRKLDDVLQNLIPLAEQGKITRFLNSAEDVDKLSGLVEDIRDAMMDYQVCPQKSHTNHA